MRIISFSADGIKKRPLAKGFYDWLSEQDADFVSASRTCGAPSMTLQDDQPFLSTRSTTPTSLTTWTARPTAWRFTAAQLPKAIMTGLGFADFDMEGRYIQADYENLSVGCLLAPRAEARQCRAAIGAQVMTSMCSCCVTTCRRCANKRREFVICGNWQCRPHRLPTCRTPSANSNDCRASSPRSASGWTSCLDRGLCRPVPRDQLGRRTSSPGGPTATDRATNGWRSATSRSSPRACKYAVDYGAIYKSPASFPRHAPVIMDYDIEL